MGNINAQRAQFFTSWPDLNVCLATSDDQFFFEKDVTNAQNHANNLRLRGGSANVDTCTRAEYDAWVTTQGGEQSAVSEEETVPENGAAETGTVEPGATGAAPKKSAKKK